MRKEWEQIYATRRRSSVCIILFPRDCGETTAVRVSGTILFKKFRTMLFLSRTFAVFCAFSKDHSLRTGSGRAAHRVLALAMTWAFKVALDALITRLEN
ncbi:hypothetical protein, partial [Paraburkholderia sediminicola]|uniref:hypothetical protein n=1 Tax=Paraburkholderia sediminicola TaxID=458836 RepID=UPI0038BA454C